MPVQSRYAGQVETFQHAGREIKVSWSNDEDAHAPWIETDCYGIVSRWTSRDKEPGEVIVATDRNSILFFDFAGTVAKFRKEGMSGQDAHNAALHSCERVRKYCSDQWSYLCATVEVDKLCNDGSSYLDCLCGIESDSAASCIPDLLAEAKAAIDKHQKENVVLVRLLLACA